MSLQTLRKAGQFRFCYRNGRKIVCEHAVVFYHPNPERDGLRVGVVASRRVGGAVKRNRAKRLLREAARNVASKWNDPNLWVVMVARGSLPEVKAAEATDDLVEALGRAGVLTK